MTATYATAQFCISLFAILVIYFRCICRQRAENCRTDIRFIRDDLFDFMWQNGYDFRSPAYQQTRTMLNGLLRLTNIMGSIQIIVLLIRCHGEKAPDSAVNSIHDVALKEKLKSATELAMRRFVEFLYLEGATGLIVRGIAFTFKAFYSLQRTTKWVKRQTALLREMADEFGQENLSPSNLALIRHG